MSCLPVNLSNSQHLHITWKNEAVFSCFYRSIFDAHFCYLVEQLIPAFRERGLTCLSNK